MNKRDLKKFAKILKMMQDEVLSEVNHIHKDNLPDVIRLLSERPLHWHMAINNLSFVEDTGEEQGVRFHFEFGG